MSEHLWHASTGSTATVQAFGPSGNAAALTVDSNSNACPIMSPIAPTLLVCSIIEIGNCCLEEPSRSFLIGGR